MWYSFAMKKRAHDIDELKKRLIEIGYLGAALGLMHWDQEVNMPKKAADGRAASLSHLSGLFHQQCIALNAGGLLSGLKKQVEKGILRGASAVIVNETWRSFEREKKLPERLVRELSAATSKAQQVWAEARAKNNFGLFLPWLSKSQDFLYGLDFSKRYLLLDL